MYKTVIKPTMTYGAECWAVRKKDENRLHVAEMRMLRWIRGNTRKDHVRNQSIQEDAKVCQMSTFLRQKWWSWREWHYTTDRHRSLRPTALRTNRMFRAHTAANSQRWSQRCQAPENGDCKGNIPRCTCASIMQRHGGTWRMSETTACQSD